MSLLIGNNIAVLVMWVNTISPFKVTPVSFSKMIAVILFITENVVFWMAANMRFIAYTIMLFESVCNTAFAIMFLKLLFIMCTTEWDSSNPAST